MVKSYNIGNIGPVPDQNDWRIDCVEMKWPYCCEYIEGQTVLSLAVALTSDSTTDWLSWCFVCTASSSLRLSISPRGTQIKTVNSGIIFTCDVVTDDDTPGQQQQQQLRDAVDMRWVGPDLQYVSSAKGSRYHINVTYLLILSNQTVSGQSPEEIANSSSGSWRHSK